MENHILGLCPTSVPPGCTFWFTTYSSPASVHFTVQTRLLLRGWDLFQIRFRFFCLFCLFIFEDLHLSGEQSRHAEVRSLLALSQSLLHKCPVSFCVWRKRLCSLLSCGCQTSRFILPCWGSPAALCGSLVRRGQTLEGDTRPLFHLQEGFCLADGTSPVHYFTREVPPLNWKHTWRGAAGASSWWRVWSSSSRYRSWEWVSAVMRNYLFRPVISCSAGTEVRRKTTSVPTTPKAQAQPGWVRGFQRVRPEFDGCFLDRSLGERLSL